MIKLSKTGTWNWLDWIYRSLLDRKIQAERTKKREQKTDCQYFYIILKNNYTFFFFFQYIFASIEPWCWVWLPATAWSLCINIKLNRTLARQYRSHAAMQSMRFKINKKSMAADKCVSWLLMGGVRKVGVGRRKKTKRRERKTVSFTGEQQRILMTQFLHGHDGFFLCLFLAISFVTFVLEELRMVDFCCVLAERVLKLSIRLMKSVIYLCRHQQQQQHGWCLHSHLWNQNFTSCK